MTIERAEEGRICQVCRHVVDRVYKWQGGILGDKVYDYCNVCQSCGRVVHCGECVHKLKDTRVAGNLWLCECGTRNEIYDCSDWDKEFDHWNI